MASLALGAFLTSLDEIVHLGKASHPQLGPTSPESLSLARAVGRGQIVLLSSHFERYIYSVNEEVVNWLNVAGVISNRLPSSVKLLHSSLPVDELSRTGWEHRSEKLVGFISQDGWLWSDNARGSLAHGRLLTWMKAPNPESIKRYFRYWGIDDIFTAITRRSTTRSELWLGIRALVELRNNIAHGDYSAQATVADVKRYMFHARTFCVRADRKLATQLAIDYSMPKPW